MSYNSRSVIRLLPQELRNQIAAGEVVERPASVLKELVENSLDAGATQIDVRLDNGGQSLVSVHDNGSGIEPDQLELAITRHATSKVSSLEDLDNILSYGFRGEALPSIASVSRFRITSITNNATDAGVGHFVEVEHGRSIKTGRAGIRAGTLVEVRDLFANTPARLKFLKNPGAEFKKAQAWLSRLALARPETGFSLYAGDRQAMNFIPKQSLSSRLAAIWPAEIVDELLPIDSTLHGITLKGLAAPPQLHQPRPDRIFFYVNNRAVNDKRLLAAVREAYKGKLVSRDYPQLVLFLNIDPSEVDVNVHPAKTEVRFRNEAALFSAVFGALGQAFERNSFFSAKAPEGFWGTIDRQPIITKNDPPAAEGEWEVILPSPPPEEKPAVIQERSDVAYVAEETAPYLKPPLPVKSETRVAAPERLQYLGQVANTYLVLKDKAGSLVLLDQHAAHERILFNRFKAGGMSGTGQTLIIPFEMAMPNADRFAKLRSALENFGFHFQPRSSTLYVNAIPPLLTTSDAREFLQEALLGLIDDPNAIFASLACRSAIKAGQELTIDEALGLLDEWLGTPDSEYCPHGRPCVLRWDGASLEKLFKRR